MLTSIALEFNEYQKAAIKTAKWHGKKYSMVGNLDALTYCVLKLNGEAGEVAELHGKLHRDTDGIITVEKKKAFVRELGDVLWYLSAIASLLDVDLAQVSSDNLAKLSKRMETGTIGGDGDYREEGK